MSIVEFIRRKKGFFLYFVLITVISLAGYYWAFDFYFIAEDWWELWVITNPKLNYLIYKTDLFANHPIETFHQMLLLPFFGYNSHLWQIFGYSTKVINSLAVVLMVWGTTNSKRVALYSGLIFATSVGGISSYHWLGRWSSALILFFLAIGFYFWAKSFPEKLFSKKYLLACFFFLLAIFGEPGRGSIVFALCLIWDVVATIKYSKNHIVKIALRNGIFVLISLVLLLIFWRDHIFNSTTNNYQDWTYYFFTHPFEVSKNFLTSLGNFISGGFVSTYDSLSMSHTNDVSFAYGIIYALITIYFLLKFIFHRISFYGQMLFFLIWIPIAFFPSWFVVHYFYAPPLIAGVTHHYFTISALGFSAALGYFLSRFNRVIGIIFLTVVVISNIIQSNRILQQEWNHRSVYINNMAWDKIDREVPADADNNSIFLFIGGDPLANDLDASEAIPFAIRRGITNPAKMPIQTVAGQDYLESFFCKERVSYLTAVREYEETKMKIPLSNLYVWEVNEGIITNVSDRERKKLSSKLKCNYIP